MPESANNIWADGPSLLPSQPQKSLIRAWGTWVEQLLNGPLNGRRLVYTYDHFQPGGDVTTAAKALYDGLSDAVVIWAPGTYDLTDYILVNGDNVTTMCPAGRDAINIRQRTWGLPVFSTADPNDTSVRPNGVRFHDMGGEAWNNGVKCYFYDAFFGLGASGPYTCAADASSTSAQVFLFRNGVAEAPASVSGAGTTTITVTLSVPQAGTDYINIKVTNKDDFYGDASLFGQGKAAESAFIFHGGGDGFVAERIWAEGFVCPIAYFGDWTSSGASSHSRDARIFDIRSNWCDFLLFSEGLNPLIDEIHCEVVSETQTDTGIVIGDTGLVYKDPHVLYVTDRSTLAVTQEMVVGRLTGSNRYSSNYKFRNINGLTVKAGVIRNFFRVLDIEQCDNAVLDFPSISGAFNGALDGQRAALNLYDVKGVIINVGVMYVTSDVCFALRFREGAQGVCEQTTVNIGELYISSAARAAANPNWLLNQGGIDCQVNVDHLHVLGADSNYIYRARQNDGAGSFQAASRGGIRVGRITRATSGAVRLAQIASSTGANPSNVMVEYSRTKNYLCTFDASTISDGGNGTVIVIDGARKLTATATAAFATPGDSTITVSNVTTGIRQVGDIVNLAFSCQLATNAYTTPSGDFTLTLAGLPAPATAMADWLMILGDLRSVDVGATIAQVVVKYNASGNYYYLRQIADDGAGSSITATSFDPSTSSYVLAFSGWYAAA